MMMSMREGLMGEVVQWLRQKEELCLRTVWGCRIGWENAEAAKAVTFDGLAPGGTGRFSGFLSREDRVGFKTKEEEEEF